MDRGEALQNAREQIGNARDRLDRIEAANLPQAVIEPIPQVNENHFQQPRGFGRGGQPPDPIPPIIQATVGEQEPVMGYPIDPRLNPQRDIWKILATATGVTLLRYLWGLAFRFCSESSKKSAIDGYSPVDAKTNLLCN